MLKHLFLLTVKTIFWGFSIDFEREEVRGEAITIESFCFLS